MDGHLDTTDADLAEHRWPGRPTARRRRTNGLVSRRTLLAAMSGIALGTATRPAPGAAAPRSTRIDEPATGYARAWRVSPPPPPPPPAPTWVEGSIGTTHQGRPIQRFTLRPPAATRHVIVVSGIHGNERITLPLAEAIMAAARPADLTLTVIPSGNPDGWAANQRRNARGVDLNRNFPWRWSRSDGGPGPGSEPETQALMHLVASERPDLVVWIHQPLAYIAPLLGCPIEYARIWANAAGVRVRPTLDQHGGGETWSSRGAGVRSMLVETTSWSAGAHLIDAHRRAFEALMPHVVPITR